MYENIVVVVKININIIIQNNSLVMFLHKRNEFKTFLVILYFLLKGKYYYRLDCIN